ncbi:hypothetical protein Plhal304r1_c016g0060131 [Plasmopara halstedii]
MILQRSTLATSRVFEGTLNITESFYLYPVLRWVLFESLSEKRSDSRYQNDTELNRCGKANCNSDSGDRCGVALSSSEPIIIQVVRI